MLLITSRAARLGSFRPCGRLFALTATAALTVSLINSPATAVTPSKVASVASLRTVVSDCNGQQLTSLIPPAGFGLPISQLGGSSKETSPGVQAAESPNIKWLPATCAASPNDSSSPLSVVSSPDNVPASGELDTQAWSGETTDSAGGNYDAVQMAWYVPSVPSAAVRRVSSLWTGLGGCSNSSDLLVQAGTESNENADGTVTYYPWWEACPMNAQQRITSFNISPRDHMSAYVEHTGYGQAFIGITDFTRSVGTGFYVHWTGYIIGGRADWILERTSYGGRHPYLAPINSGTYSRLFYLYAEHNGSNSWVPLITLRRYYVYMWTCSYTTRMAHTGSILSDGASVAVYFDSSGDNDLC